MAIHPRQLPMTSKERELTRLRDLERRIGIIERTNAGGLQHAHASGSVLNSSASLGGSTDPIVSVTVNVPSDDFHVLFWFSGTLKVSVNTTTAWLYLVDSVDFPGGIAYLNTFDTAGVLINPMLVNNTGIQTPPNSQWQSNFTIPWEPYRALGTPALTPGEHTYTLGVGRTGAGTASATLVNMWVLVV